MAEELEKSLGIGQYHVTTRPTKVSTLLGSCVAVTMHHPARGYGAICHASLPATPPGQGVDYRYIDQVIPTMADWFDRHKIPRQELAVKLFGGGEMFGSAEASRGSLTLGRRNIMAARKILQEQGLVLSASDVGGRQGRHLSFHTASGRVWVRKNPTRGHNPPSTPTVASLG